MKKYLLKYALSFLFLGNMIYGTTNSNKLNYDMGDKLWNIKFISLKNREEIVTLDSLRGKKVLLNFSATWCGDCQKEKPIMNAEYINKFKNDSNIEFIIVMGPLRSDNPEVIKKYMSDNNYSFPVYYDYDKELLQEFGIQRIPTNILIDEEGKIEEIDVEHGYKHMNYFK